MNKTFKTTFLYAFLKHVLLLIIISIIILLKLDISLLGAKYLHINLIPYMHVFSLILFFIYAYYVFYTYLTTYKITEEQLSITYGIFSINTDYLELYRIKDIEIKSPFLLRLIGLYNLKLYTSDISHSIIILEGINIKNLPLEIRNQVEKLRKIKGVYEID